MGGTWLLALVMAQAAPQAAGRDQERATIAAARQEAGAVPATVDVRSTLGKRFRFVEAQISVDGREVNRITAPHGEALVSSFRAFDGALAPGRHTIAVTLIYEGRNTGVFTYLDNMRYVVQSSGEFAIEAGTRPAAVEVFASERAGATVPVDEKPTVELRTVAGTAVTPVSRSAPQQTIEAPRVSE
jgi:hypothetical protein